MKKLVALLLALSLSLALFGCAAQQPETPVEPEVAQPTVAPDPAVSTDDPIDGETAGEPIDESTLTEPGIEESWTGTILEVFTEGGGADSAQVVKVQSGEDIVCFTLEQSSSCVRSSSGEEENIAPSELVPGTQVEIEGFLFSDSSYRPISVIRVLEEENVNIHPLPVAPVDNTPVSQPYTGVLMPADNTDITSMTEPPMLTVVNGSMQIEALRGGWCWEYPNGDGTSTAVIADCAHPLDMQQLVPALPCQPSRAGSLDAHTAYLCFDAVPDKVTVRCWSTDCWGNIDAVSESVLASDFSGNTVLLASGSSASYYIPLTENNCVYEVTAVWSGDDGCGGNATYSFYTRWADAEISPPKVELSER